jgi:hypothetical protein
MSTELALRCGCGTLRGTLAVRARGEGNRCVCHCRHCQAFARALAQQDVVLDAHGGTDLYQTSPSCLTITQGRDELACLQLTRRGPLRWYARCCGTLLANTARSAGLPFVSVVVSSLHDAGGAASGSPEAGSEARSDAIDAAIGPVRHRIFARAATGDRASLRAHDGVPPAMLCTLLWQLLVNRLRGEHRRSTFFDADSLQPVAAPRCVDLPSP